MRISDWSSDVCSSDLEDPHELLALSPFDWASQALCYLPPGLPQPSARDYTAAIAEVLLPVLHASQGRAFVLFASHRALREAAAIRSEEHTSELQSLMRRSYAVFCLKKKRNKH